MTQPVRVFLGSDSRQPLAVNVAQWSIQRNSNGRVVIEPLMLHKLPISRIGLTQFTWSRFLVPFLCDYTGTAIFMDADVVVTGDVADLAAQADGVSAVQVMQDQPKFEWPSVMLFNCANCEVLTPEYVDDATNALLSLNWGEVGSFSPEWNHLCGYSEPKEAKLYHYSQGLPCWYECQGMPEDVFWQREYDDMIRTCTWAELMGKSIHAQPVIKRMLAQRYGIRVAEPVA